MKGILTLIAVCFLTLFSRAQQKPDTSFTFPIRQAAYSPGQGPVIFIDEAHHNFHTKDDGFFAFSKLLEEDGYRVRKLCSPVNNPEILTDCRILVIANALDSSNLGRWILPTPSAFSKDEILALKLWVKNGGKLLLIADHMPFAGAAYKLGKAFGFEFINGFAFFNEKTWPPMVFTYENQTLPPSPIAEGIMDYEKVDQVATFTGSAFFAPDASTPVLSFLDGVTFQPDTAWEFHKTTPWENLAEYHQGAVRKFGKGRVAIFGEAAMFTAQLVYDTIAVGFNSKFAQQNAQFTLNLIHWLDGVNKYQGEMRGER